MSIGCLLSVVQKQKQKEKQKIIKIITNILKYHEIFKIHKTHMALSIREEKFCEDKQHRCILIYKKKKKKNIAKVVGSFDSSYTTYDWRS